MNITLIQNQNNDLQPISKIIILFPIAFIAGPAILEMLIFFSIIFFFYEIIKKKTYYYFNNNIVKLFLFIWIYLLINSLLSVEILISFKSSLFYIRFLLVALAIYYAIENDKHFIKYFTFTLGSCFFVLFIDSVFQFFNENKLNLIGMLTPESNDRLSSFFHKEMILGSYISRLFPLLLIYFLPTDKKIYFFLLITIIIVVLSGERTAIGIFILFLLMFFFISKVKLKKILLIFFTFLSIFLFVLSQNGYKNRYIDLVKKEFIEKKNNISKINFFTPKHTSLYFTSYNMFLDKKLFGNGVNTFRHLCFKSKFAHNKESCSTHPHNIPLQILAELGIFGFFLYCFAMVLLCKKIFFSNESYIEKILLTTFIINLFPFFPSGNLFNNWFSAITYLPLGFYIYYNQKKKN